MISVISSGFPRIVFTIFLLSNSICLIPAAPKPVSFTGGCESCAFTVVLGKDNTIQYYEGDLAKHPPVKETSFGAAGIRQILLDKRKMVKTIRGNPDEITLIIKPSDASTFQNFVDMMDEVEINNIKKYYIDELTVEDKKLLKGRN